MTTLALDRIAQAVVAANAAPAVTCAAGFRAENGWCFGVGAAGTLWPISNALVVPETVFDLASLTKPLISIAAATESARDRLDWGWSLQELLPEMRGTGAATATLEQLLSHRAGLAPHLELFRRLRSGLPFRLTQVLRDAANATNDIVDDRPIVGRAVYSDLGYLLAGAAIQRRLASPLDRWLSELFPTLTRSKLGSVRFWLNWDSEFRLRCAPTEVVPWRKGLVWSRVHDENAWMVGGHGLCGHAGLFGTAIGVVSFGAAVLDSLAERPSCVPTKAAHLVTRQRPMGTLCAGFDRKSVQGSTAGVSSSPQAFGHLGFTGTSLWCDPTESLVVTILSNRVCPDRRNIILRDMRAKLHDSLFEWARSQRVGQSASFD